MLIPVRCFTCGAVLSDKYEYYKRRCVELEKDPLMQKHVDEMAKKLPNFEGFYQGKVLDELGIKKMCCRRCMLSAVDLIEII